MKHYIALVHKEEGSAWGVTFPDIPGCFSAADDLNDVVANAVDALQLWAEDEAMPEPSDMESIRAAHADDIADGALLMLIPFIGSDAKPVRVNISMERGMMEAIDAAATERHLTRSAFLADAARKVIEGRV